MTPQDILTAMSFYGDANFSIRHSEAQTEWAIRPDSEGGPRRMFGDSNAKINKRHPVTIEFTDPAERPGNAVNAALRRLNALMSNNGFVEQDLQQHDFGATITYIGEAQAADN